MPCQNHRVLANYWGPGRSRWAYELQCAYLIVSCMKRAKAFHGDVLALPPQLCQPPHSPSHPNNARVQWHRRTTRGGPSGRSLASLSSLRSSWAFPGGTHGAASMNAQKIFEKSHTNREWRDEGRKDGRKRKSRSTSSRKYNIHWIKCEKILKVLERLYFILWQQLSALVSSFFRDYWETTCLNICGH